MEEFRPEKILIYLIPLLILIFVLHSRSARNIRFEYRVAGKLFKEEWHVIVPPKTERKEYNPFNWTFDSNEVNAIILSFLGRRHEVCSLL